MPYTPEQIAAACDAPLANVQRTWPIILAALDWQDCNTHATRVAMAATIAVETGVTENGQNMTFLPVSELDGAAQPYAPYYGRGVIQCTWESNYAHYGPLLDPPHNLVAEPDLLLQEVPSAQMAALYFQERGIPQLAAEGNWEAVRVAVNGGLNGYEAFLGYVQALEAIPEPMPAPPAVPLRRRAIHACALKRAPNHTSGALGDIPAGGQLIDFGSRQDGWAAVQYRAGYGWILADNIEDLQGASV